MKKMLIITLVLALMLTTVGFASAETSYWEELKSLYEWDAMEGDVAIELTLVVPPDLNHHYNIHMYSQTNLKDFISYTEMHIQDAEGLQSIPTIKTYTQGSNLYINREAILALLASMGQSEVVDISEEYVMLQNNENAIEMNGNVLKDMLAFIEEMDLGMDLGMTQEDNVYTLTLESDEMIDLLDAYMQYILNNIDQFPSSLMPSEAIPTEEEMQEALQAYNTFLAPYKEMAKEFTKGSFYHQVSTFEEDSYHEDATLTFVTPMGQLNMQMTSTSEKLDSSTIQLPTSVMVITEEEFTNLLIGGFTTAPSMELKAVIDLEGNYAKLGEAVEEGKLSLHLLDQRAHITMTDASNLFGIELGDSQDLIAVRDLENYGYQVMWNATNNTIQIYQ